MSILNEKLENINLRSEKLHRGVYYKRIVIGAEGEVERDAISENATLPTVIVDALGAIFNMIVRAVYDARYGPALNHPESLRIRGPPKVGKSVPYYATEACEMLWLARNQLITDSTGFSSSEHIGPVLTPQTLLILLMERLANGVYGCGNVEITAVLNESLAQLVSPSSLRLMLSLSSWQALKVSSHASRRLLLMLNAFEEEVTIIENVFKQQEMVLQEFRQTLDPSSFRSPSIARKIEFDYENQAIERILTHIHDQKACCPELKQRAKALAIQNVQLIETQQDANSRAILIFTLITVLFVPLSFVAGFFGMNVAGINPTTSTTMHFWAVAFPLTGAIVLLSAFILLVGEDRWAAAMALPSRLWRRLIT